MKTYRAVRIVLPVEADSLTRRFAVELAQIVGLYSVSMVFPLAAYPDEPRQPDTLYFVLGSRQEAPPGENEVCLSPKTEEEAIDIWKRLFRDYERLARTANPHEVPAPEGFRAASDEALAPVCLRHEGGLEDLFEPGWILHDDDLDGIPDRVDCRILLTSDVTDAQVRAACDIAARLGMETAAIRYPLILATDDGVSNLFAFRVSPNPAITLAFKEPRKVISVEGDGVPLVNLVSAWANQFPLVADRKRLTDVARHVEAAVRMENYDGQAAVINLHTGEGPVDALMSPDAPLERLRKRWPAFSLRPYTDVKQVFTYEYDLPWEADVAWGVLEEKVFPALNAGDRVALQCELSENREVRERFAERFRERVRSQGASPDRVVVLCAYKPGLSWLEEDFARRAAASGPVKRVEIRFGSHVRPGAPVAREPDSVWKEIDEKSDKPPRWLQNLYPVDDLIAPILGITPQDVVFEAYTGVEDTTYEALAFDDRGRCLYRDTYKVHVHERKYLDAFPEQGVAAPTTGWLKVVVNGQVWVDQRIPTDADVVWDVYQTQVLPALRDFLIDKGGQDLFGLVMPCFGRLELEIWISEPERELPFRNDIISSAETLSEDMYAAGRAYAGVLGIQKRGKRLDACGLMLPLIHIREGKPFMRVTLYDHLASGPRVYAGKTVILPADSEVSVHLSRVTLGTDGLELWFDVQCPKKLVPRISALGVLTAEGETELARMLEDYETAHLSVDSAPMSIRIPKAPKPVRDLRIEDLALHNDRVIGYDDWMRIADDLRRVPGFHVYKAGVSYYGRAILAIEPECGLPGYVSNTKRVLRNPSLLVNGRHHANEVSASNAILRFLSLLGDERYREEVSSRLNLVIVPMENPDGVALHYELQKEHPRWHHHTAYATPSGRDIAAMYFAEGLLNAEGKVLAGIYRRMLPDAFIDLHGVPSHDWLSQFGRLDGYKGLWLPRALLCAFYWCPSDRRYEVNRAVNRVWADSVAEAYHEHAHIKQLNVMWRERFDKYSHNGINMDFPCAFENEMLNYWVSQPYSPKHPYLSIRFPWITTVSFTAEAADETVHGVSLRNCADAQLVHLCRGVRLATEAQLVYDRSLLEEAGTITARAVRRRPFLLRR
jgi:hypothetical protein